MPRRPPTSPPFPTRRSSDLPEELMAEHARLLARMAELEAEFESLRKRPVHQDEHRAFLAKLQAHIDVLHEHIRKIRARSEEHTSELQSRRDLVCRLLLEKKK